MHRPLIFVYLFRVSRAVCKVYSLAFLHLNEVKIGVSCAAFLEMLGRDSSSMRIDLEAARRIEMYGLSKVKLSFDNEEETEKARKLRHSNTGIYKQSERTLPLNIQVHIILS